MLTRQFLGEPSKWGVVILMQLIRYSRVCHTISSCLISGGDRVQVKCVVGDIILTLVCALIDAVLQPASTQNIRMCIHASTRLNPVSECLFVLSKAFISFPIFIKACVISMLSWPLAITVLKSWAIGDGATRHVQTSK